MRGDRHKILRISDQFGTGTMHHARHGDRERHLIAEFQPMHHFSRHALVSRDHARPVVDWRFGYRGRRQERAAKVDGEWRSQPLAERPRDKADAAPTAGAEPMRFADRSGAGDALRRIDKVRAAPRQPLRCSAHLPKEMTDRRFQPCFPLRLKRRSHRSTASCIRMQARATVPLDGWPCGRSVFRRATDAGRSVEL